MRLVLIESPLAARGGRTVEDNVEYAMAAMRDCLARGEAPFASHVLYARPGILDDLKPNERTLGIHAGLAWGAKADATVVYTDYGISSGMEVGIARAKAEGRPIELRSLDLGSFLGTTVAPSTAAHEAPDEKRMPIVLTGPLETEDGVCWLAESELDADLSAHSATPGLALAHLGHKIDAHLAAIGWKAVVR